MNKMKNPRCIYNYEIPAQKLPQVDMYGNKSRTVRFSNPINIGLFAGTNSKNIDSAMMLAQKLIGSVNLPIQEQQVESMTAEEMAEVSREQIEREIKSGSEKRLEELKKELEGLGTTSEILKNRRKELEKELEKVDITQEEMTSIFEQLDELRNTTTKVEVLEQIISELETPQEPEP